MVLELATPHIHAHVAAREEELRVRLAENEALLRSDGDVAQLFGTRAGATVLVAAAGPILADHMERLAERSEEELLVCVDAALRSLLDGGVVPDFTVTVEHNRVALLPYFDGDLSALADAGLVYEPPRPGRRRSWRFLVDHAQPP